RARVLVDRHAVPARRRAVQHRTRQEGREIAGQVLVGVAGWPVAHSRSPAMHNAAFAASGLGGWFYTRLPLPPELFAETVRALPSSDYRGLNVTIPHKEVALALADEVTATATAIGAANTLTFGPDGAIEAENTDAQGFLDA